MSELSFQHYMQISDPESEKTFKSAMEASGYFSFYKFVEDFRNGLKAYSDAQIVGYRLLLERARRLFPAPERFSPSWDTLWEEYDLIYAAKNEVLLQISAADRAGEWQIVIDNPYTHQPVVCYPNLKFLEAAYMYGYFQRDLKPHENLRLQKVTNLLLRHGRKEASIFPDS
ncbi:hypothetical protein [Cohnella sp.]|uniref:hypothetical protein n=1 Tax=Cohnella sp. TaxID=1883426 RepID=UPI003562040E